MRVFSTNSQLSAFDRLEIMALTFAFRVFRPLVKRYYLFRKLYNPNIHNEQHIFFFRNGKRLSKKFYKLLENVYPDTSLELQELVEKLRSGYSLSRFGDGEYAMMKGHVNQTVYFDRVTAAGQKKLFDVLKSANKKHLIAIINKDVVARQLTFSNAMSCFKNGQWFSPRSPIFSEYDEDMLRAYRSLSQSKERVYEAGLFRNSDELLHTSLWQGKDILYVTCLLYTSPSPRDRG